MKILLQIALVVLPWFVRRRLLQTLLGWQLDSTASVGFTIIIAENVSLSAGARIGHLNYIKNLEDLNLGVDASIGNMNLISGSHSTDLYRYSSPKSQLLLEDGAAITHEHRIDCADSVKLGRYSTLAGRGTQVWTHGIDVVEGVQSTRPVVIGSYALVGSRCVFLKGAQLGECVVVGAGAVVHGAVPDRCLVVGVPARVVRKFDGDELYFTRKSPRVE
ncbi:MAG: acyltransferase [Mesorhizobium sp.]